MEAISVMVNKISEVVERITEIAVVPFTLGFFALTFMGVVTRFVLKIPFVSSMELSRICFVWFCFLGSSLAYKKSEHIQFTFFMNHLPVRSRNVLKVILDSISILFFIVLVYQSIKLNLNVSTTVFPASGLSLNIMYISLPVMAVFLVIHGLYFLTKDLAACLGRERGDSQW